jgi:hypothetical protein
VQARGELAAFVERIRLAASALSRLVGPASAVGPDLVDAIRATGEEVDRWLGSKETVVALAGDDSAKRSLLNAIIGARAFDPAARSDPDAVVLLRPARAFDYSARKRDRTVVEFGWRMPPREEAFAKAQQRAESEWEAAEAAERELRERLEDARQEAAEKTLANPSKDPPPPELLPPLRRVLRWLARLSRLVKSVLARRRGGPAELPGSGWTPEEAQAARERELAEIERSFTEAGARLKQATARVEALRTERPKYDQERAEAFVQDVRALTDRSVRGDGVISLTIACPTVHLPPDMAIVDAGETPYASDGVLVVALGNGAPKPGDLEQLAETQRPARVHVVHKLADLAAAFDRVRAEQPVVAAARAATAVRACIVRVAEEGARAEATCAKRIAALEGQRIPDPTEFRARQMERVGRAIDEAARDVQAGTLERWHAAIGGTKQEWRAGIEGCSTRKQMETFVRTVNRTARTELQKLVDEVSQYAIFELQRVSESIQTWLLEEIHARYHVARRIEEDDGLAAVIGEVIQMEPLGRSPLESALDKFETRRMNLGLGGVAAGAVLGTLIVPGVGTAIGAFVGVFAGLLKGLDSLKQECVARLDGCLDEVERSVASQLAGRQATFAEELRASLDDALDAALQRLDASISRLMALERRVLETERKKREDLATLRSTLEENVVKIATPVGMRGLP